MEFSAKNLNRFLFLKLPSAFLCGVRVKSITANQCVVSVRHRWINQNPFNSMYFAVQAMAAELSTGALVMLYIRNSNAKISMLVTASKSTFTKKAVGRIHFTCSDADLIANAISETIASGNGQSFVMRSVGINEQNEQVATFEFEWSIRAKQVS